MTFHVPFASRHEFAAPLQPSLAAILTQLVMVVFLLQGTVQVLATFVLPYYAPIVDACGAVAAVFVGSSVITLAVHAVGALLTLPALLGVKFGKLQVERAATFKEFAPTLPLIVFNALLGTCVGGVVALLQSPRHVLEKPWTDLPSGPSLSIQGFVFFFCSELYFFYSHKAMHDSKVMYKYVHKLHHTWTAPVALIATYTSPIEHILVNTGSVMVGPILCQSHPVVTLAWAGLALVHTFLVHSGYWADDLGMHDLHHEKFTCNYGIVGICDYMHGTYLAKSYFEASMEQRRAAVAKERAKEQ